MKWHQHKRYKRSASYAISCNPFKYPICYNLYCLRYYGVDLKEAYERYIKLLYEKG